MKRALIGGFMALLGTIWGAGVIIAASQMLVDHWGSAGRLMTTIIERQLMFPAVISVLFILLGLVIMGVEYFKK